MMGRKKERGKKERRKERKKIWRIQLISLEHGSQERPLLSIGPPAPDFNLLAKFRNSLFIDSARDDCTLSISLKLIKFTKVII